MEKRELIESILDDHEYSRKVIDNDGTPQISLNKEASQKYVGLQIGDKAELQLKYSEKYDWFYWVVFPEEGQPSAEEIREVIRENV